MQLIRSNLRIASLQGVKTNKIMCIDVHQVQEVLE